MNLLKKKTLDDAISYCQSLKNNYRLPTKIELKSLLESKDLLNYNEKKFYWSSEMDGLKGWCLRFSDSQGFRVKQRCGFPFFIVKDLVK